MTALSHQERSPNRLGSQPETSPLHVAPDCPDQCGFSRHLLLVRQARHLMTVRAVRLWVASLVALIAVGVGVESGAGIGSSGEAPDAVVLLRTSSGPCAGQPSGCGRSESSAAALAKGSWSTFPTGPFAQRAGPFEVWTGRELILWGGSPVDDPSATLGGGAAYDPLTRRWHMLPPAPVSPPQVMSAVWTGTEMLLVGGQGPGSSGFNNSAAYDPATNSWRNIAAFPLKTRFGASVIWTGRQLIVIGGYPPSPDSNVAYNDGAAYTPATGKWELLPSLPAVDGTLAGVVTAWTGTDLITWTTSIVKPPCPGMASLPGGSTVKIECTSTGQEAFALHAGASTWDVLSKPPVQTENAVIAWTGSSILVIGGEFCPVLSCGIQSSDAASYDPAAQQWTNVAFPAQWNGAWPGVWTGRVFIGPDPNQTTSLQIGAYDPVTHTWTALPTPPHSVAYALPEGVWTGRQVLFWGSPSEALTVGG